MIIGTAGHIDHGKTALVRALTGIDTDRLKEEKQRGISIDLGFAYWPLPDGSTIGFVDVPGHERFIHNMLAGALLLDHFILVVAANEGVKPQTDEHLEILDLLGVSRGLIALTKSDLVTEAEQEAVSFDIRQRLASTTLSAVPIIPVSSITGEGIDRIRREIATAAQNIEKGDPRGRFRLAIDRSFTLPGIGTVVTGTAISGSVSVGDQMVISPCGLKVNVRSIHVQNCKAVTGRGGDRCALNLTGVGVNKESIARGDMIVDPQVHSPTNRIDVSLRMLAGEKRRISQWMPVKLHHATTEISARVVLLSDQAPSLDRNGFVQLVLDRPIAAAVGDRFIIRDISGRQTLGGGRFLDLRAPSRRRRTSIRMEQLSHLSIPTQKALVGLLKISPHYVDITAFGQDRALSSVELLTLIEKLSLVTLTTRDRVFVLSKAGALDLEMLVLAALSEFHRRNPDVIGVGCEQLRLKVQPRLPTAAFYVFLQKLIESRLVVLEGTWVRLVSHTLRLTAADEERWRRISPLLSEARRFRPPNVRELGELLDETEVDVRRLLRTLAKMGKVQEVSQDLFFSRVVLAEILDIVVDNAEADGGWIATSTLRDRLRIGRKTSIELLEFFDRQAVTMRRGNVRMINMQRIIRFKTGDRRNVGVV